MRRSDGRRYLPDRPAWSYGSWDGSEYLMLQKSAAMSFRERLQWLEAAVELAQACRRKTENDSSPAKNHCRQPKQNQDSRN